MDRMSLEYNSTEGSTIDDRHHGHLLADLGSRRLQPRHTDLARETLMARSIDATAPRDEPRLFL